MGYYILICVYMGYTHDYTCMYTFSIRLICMTYHVVNCTIRRCLEEKPAAAFPWRLVLRLKPTTSFFFPNQMFATPSDIKVDTLHGTITYPLAFGTCLKITVRLSQGRICRCRVPTIDKLHLSYLVLQSYRLSLVSLLYCCV